MINSIRFNDVSDLVAQAKVDASECDAEWDRDYEEYVEKKARLDREQAEYERMAMSDPEKYPERMSPRARHWADHEVRRRTQPTRWQDMLSIPYENALESLNGREIRFTGGLNVVVGANGSGKTSLLNVIRRIFFAYGKPSSALVGESYWWTDMDSVASMLGICDLRADFGKSLFNMLHDKDIGEANIWSCGSGSFLQKFCGFSASNGEKSVMSISRLFGEFGDEEARDMGRMVVAALEEGRTKFMDHTNKAIDMVLGYYRDHHVPGDKWTMVMDEPDEGLDVFAAGELASVLERIADDAPGSAMQPIVVLHNASIISRLMGKGCVNFIEMTPGYLKAVEEFTH